MLSEAGAISFILANPSQMASIKGSIPTFQKKRFGKQVFTLDYTIQELSKIEVLNYILRTLETADKNHCPVIMRSSLPQMIFLKFLMEAFSYKDQDSQERILLKLQQILNVFAKKALVFTMNAILIFQKCLM
ncbi:MAG: hypothetical protein HWD61_06260 [Parachlamydiaceae bacterium]|nr:MAG: hypothetical protein HWD61_06260 [Parachlamydiaceae bacterium]